MPPHTVFIDFLRYVHLVQDPKVPGKEGERRTPRYVAFVLRRGQPVRRVELGPAAPIETALTTWRQDIIMGRSGPAAETLSRLVWKPLAEHVPVDTKTVYLAPDGPRATLPWAALPGREKGTVLLEDYALSLVPYGPFLLDGLTAAPESDQETGLLLAVGDVSYDQQPEPIRGAKGLLVARSAERGRQGGTWLPLKGTLQELEVVRDLAGKRPVRSLRGTEARTARLIAELPQAWWMHIATHGFFADPSVPSILQLDRALFEHGRSGERAAAGARNLLILSGLVLAGANLPPPQDLEELLRSDGGILTAEVVAGLPLEHLELVVLSACETGLGEVAGGEGVFGLQRAYHLAGARNVIASLWRVNDAATVALLRLFYRKLWRDRKPAVVALREAQLALYRHPEQIEHLAQDRGPDFDRVVQRVERDDKPPRAATAPTKLWAAFVLSGMGR